MTNNMTPPGPSGSGGASVSVDPLDESDVIADMAAALEVDENRFREAWLFSVEAHRGQLDKAGNDYFTAHVLPVTERAVTSAPPQLKTAVALAALLHDTVEDAADDPLDMLQTIQALFGCETRSDVDALTQRIVGTFPRTGEAKWEPYDRYLKRAVARPVSAIVKLADNLTNGDEAKLMLIENNDTREYLRDKYRAPRMMLRRAVRAHLVRMNLVGAGGPHENERGDRK